jgi:hypothetical protein
MQIPRSGASVVRGGVVGRISTGCGRPSTDNSATPDGGAEGPEGGEGSRAAAHDGKEKA